MRIKIAVVGSRKYRRIEKVQDYLKNLDRDHSHIITGDASGVDFEAVLWAKEYCIPYTVYPALWRPDGPDGPMDRGAGLKRNREIAQDADDMTVFWDEMSRGSADDIRIWWMKTGHQPHVYGSVGLPIEVSHQEIMDFLFGKEVAR